MSEVQKFYEITDADREAAIFIERGLARALRFRASDRWLTDNRTLEDLIRLLEAEVLADWYRNQNEEVVLELPHAVIHLGLERRPDAVSRVWVSVLAGSRRAAKMELARIRELLPVADPPTSNLIDVGFWYRSADGPKKVKRSLEATAWTETDHNYPMTTRLGLEPSMADAAAVISSGKLLLWHGPPGTGKTSALRTVARENRDSVGLEYVLDPGAFFGHDAGYFVSVLFDDEDDEGHRKIRLVVLEDCDELLSADAKERAGQGLARLLNLVDGMIGQGLKIAVVITTNEPISTFHPAVSRPGRCGSMVAFEPFSPDEATVWLANRGVKTRAARRSTLAELFAIREGREKAADSRPSKEPIGFLAPAPGK